MTRFSAAFVSLLLGSVSIAYADIPVLDTSNLTQRSRTKSHTAETAKVQKKTKASSQGIDCATHEGDKKADAKEQREKADSTNGNEAIEAAGGGEPTQGPSAVQEAQRNQREQTAAVIGETEATEAAIKGAEKAYKALGEKIGTTDTIKGAYDQNSIIATQNGLASNNAIATLNSLVRAFNLKNQLELSETSQSVRVASAGSNENEYQCSEGTEGKGTRANPCVSAHCQVAPSEATPDGCFKSWFIVDENFIVSYLTHPTETIYVTGRPTGDPQTAIRLEDFQQ